MTAKALKDVLDRLETWPQEDQEALAEYARELEARRTGMYRLTEAERAAIQRARQGEYVSDEEMDAYWKRAAHIPNATARALAFLRLR